MTFFRKDREDARAAAIESLARAYADYLMWQRMYPNDPTPNAESFLDWVRDEIEDPK